MAYAAICNIQVCWVGAGTNAITVPASQSLHLSVPMQLTGSSVNTANISSFTATIAGAISAAFTGTVQAQLLGFATGGN